MALHAAAGLHLGGNESYPGVFLPFGGFAGNMPVRDGEVELTDAPGIGIELNSDLYALFKTHLCNESELLFAHKVRKLKLS